MLLIISLLLSSSYYENPIKCGKYIPCICPVRNYTNFKMISLNKKYVPHIVKALDKWSLIVENFEDIPILFTSEKLKNKTLAFAKLNNENDLFGGGNITINSGIIFDNSTLVDTLVHEIGHILGIGTNKKWVKSRLTHNKNRKTYLNMIEFHRTSAIYNVLVFGKFVKGKIFHAIPLDILGHHWREEIFPHEIMSSSIIKEEREYISSLTLAALEDLGHTINRDYNEDSEFMKRILINKLRTAINNL